MDEEELEKELEEFGRKFVSAAVFQTASPPEDYKESGKTDKDKIPKAEFFLKGKGNKNTITIYPAKFGMFDVLYEKVLALNFKEKNSCEMLRTKLENIAEQKEMDCGFIDYEDNKKLTHTVVLKATNVGPQNYEKIAKTMGSIDMFIGGHGLHLEMKK